MTNIDRHDKSDYTAENDNDQNCININSNDDNSNDCTTTTKDCLESNYDALLKPNKEFVRKDTTISFTTSRDLEFCIQTVLKQAVKEDKLVHQLFYTMLSAYTNNPINLAINASSGEGKTHVLTTVANLFPQKDVLSVTDMSNKAIFHKNGYIGVKNEDGEYVNVEHELEQLKEEFENLKNKLSNRNICKSDEFVELRNQLNENKRRRNEIQKSAVKVIDLSRKIIIFLDTPREGIFEGLMTLLSHDKFESEYHYVDTSSKTGIATKVNVLKGWPAVIFAQAIDYTGHPRYQEIQRRFIVTNPRMDAEKYEGAVYHILQKNCLPDDVYQNRVVNDKDKEVAREIILNIRDDTLFFSSKTKPGKNNILIPFLHVMKQMVFLSRKITAQEMNFTNRLMSLVGLFTIINHKKRPSLEVTPAFASESMLIPISMYSDLKEALNLINNSPAGIRPYVWEWYQNVFLKSYQSKIEPDSKITQTRGEIIEERIAVTTQELIENTKVVLNKKCTTKSIQQEFIYPLSNIGYIDCIQSEIDRRANIYFPADPTDEKNSNLFLFSDKNNLIEENNEKDRNSSVVKDKQIIISNINEIIKYYSENDNLVAINYASYDREHSTEDYQYITVEDIVERYYVDLIGIKKNDRINDKVRADVDVNNATDLPDSKEYSPIHRNNDILQEKQKIDIKNNNISIVNSNNLFLDENKNKIIYSCYIDRCNFQTLSEYDYQKHYVTNHPHKLAFPSLADILKHGLKPQGKPWE